MERFTKAAAAALPPPPTSPTAALAPLSAIPFERLALGAVVGRGAFGAVHRGTFQGAPVAIKRVPLRALQAQAALQKYLLTELQALAAVQHPHLLHYHGAAQHEGELFIVTEFMEGGDLRGVLAAAAAAGVALPWRLRVALARAAAEGLAALHGAELLHRDIKTENLLLDDGWRIKIADYGFAKKVADLKGGRAQPGTIVGTETFMAPEVIFGEAYGEHADVFSLGCVLAEVLTGRVPGVGGFLERTPRSKFAADLEQLRAAAPPDAPASFVECVCQCLAYEPEARLTSDDALLWLRDLEGELPEVNLEALPRPSALQQLGREAAAAAAGAAGAAGVAGEGEGEVAAAVAGGAAGAAEREAAGGGGCEGGSGGGGGGGSSGSRGCQ
jgi:serine/threonine protein kinase